MRRSGTALLTLALALMLAAPIASAEEGKVTVPEDLFAVITLRGKPCGKVESYERSGDDDYLVTCETGDRYRVYVDENDRVVVEKR